ncbi:hypothetical protein PC112_g22026 [Phytophthora cactorum]|nr:hypothetical protein PC112_g22026 [Phytophthora cactorum]
MNNTKAKQKRRSYIIKDKLAVIAEHEEGVAGSGFYALSNKHDVASGTLRGWWQNRQKLQDASKDKQIATRTARRLGGGGRGPKYPEVEERLHLWILDRNAKGLRVKDSYIRLQAQTIYRKLRGPDGPKFDASTGRLARFKKRKQLVSRRQTTTRTLPEDAAHTNREFIQRVQQLIELHQIQPRNIVNMDQVPRYFEMEPKTTIATRGSREVLLRKGGTSHKRFAATFSITADGTMLQPHLLFSKLKNRPTVPDGLTVDVNRTGMWSDEILLEHAKKVLYNRKETQLYREPVLYLIDSYGCHVKLMESRRLERYITFVVIIPPNLTNILQPLDVAVNRSFQAYYRNKYDEYIGNALQDPALQTRTGNRQVPNYSTVGQWTLDWMATRTPESIVKAFQLCGLVPKEMFSEDKLHSPLREILSPDLNMDRWHASYQHLLEQAEDLEQLFPQLQNGISPTRNGPASFRASFMAWGLVEMTSSLILQTTWRH